MRLTIENGVVDGDCRAPGKLLGKAQIILVEMPAGLGGDQGERSERAPARYQRDDHCRDEPELPEDLQMFGIDSRGPEQLLGNLPHELCTPGANHLVHSAGSIGVGGILPIQLERQLDLRRIDMGHDQPLYRCSVIAVVSST